MDTSNPQGSGGGFGLSDLFRTLLSLGTGGLAGAAFSPAADPLWEKGGERLGMEGDQTKSLARLLMAGLAGGGLLPLGMAGWQVAKNFSTPTQARWWDTPASGPNGLFEYGRSEPAAFLGQGGEGYGYRIGSNWSPTNPMGLDFGSHAQVYDPRHTSPAYAQHDVSVGPGSAAGMNALMNQPYPFQRNGGPGAVLGRAMGNVQKFLGGQGGPFPGESMGMPQPMDPFARTRELLGMGSPGPDFAAARQRLGMGG